MGAAELRSPVPNTLGPDACVWSSQETILSTPNDISSLSVCPDDINSMLCCLQIKPLFSTSNGICTPSVRPGYYT